MGRPRVLEGLAAQRLFPVILLCAAGLLAWALWQDEPDPEDHFTEPGVTTGPLDREPAAHPAAGAAEATGSLPRARSSEAPKGPQDVPRLLPPDAAIEDVRDALAQPAGQRARALELAYRSIGQLARKGGGVLNGLRRYLEAVDDPRVRGVSTAALGSNRSDAHLGWLAERLGEAPSTEDRLGALIALARGTAPGTNGAKTATASSLGGLTYPIGALPARSDVRISLARFLDNDNPGAATDALPILMLSLGGSGAEAALLVTKDGRPCRWLAALPVAERTTLVAAVLRHRELPAQVRVVLEAIPAR